MIAIGLLLLLQAVAQDPPHSPRIPVKLGVRTIPDTVTVGQRFVVVLRVRAPAGASIQFPGEKDSAMAVSPTSTQIIGKPVVQIDAGPAGTNTTAAYRLAAWDTGAQSLSLGNIVVRVGGQTGYVSLGDRTVFVRSVLPADSALRIPRPPRDPITLVPFNWLPWLILPVVLLLAAIAWWLWRLYRRRRDATLHPYAEAQREFGRVEAMRLVDAGEGERHTALMADVMRKYLAARIPEIALSQTSSELIAASGSIHLVASGLGELLWDADLVKFARNRITPADALEIGQRARAIVQAIEDESLRKEKDATRKRAA